MVKNNEQSGKQRTGAISKGSFDNRKYVPRQESDLEKYTHRVLIGNSSGTHKELIQGPAKKLNLFSLSLSEAEVMQIMEDHYQDNLKEFLDNAIKKNLEVLMSVELERGQYRSPCWQFVSELRGHPFFRGLKSNDAVEILDSLIDWNDLPDCDIYGIDAIDPIDEIIDAWNYQDNHQIAPLYPSVHPNTIQAVASEYPLSKPKERANYCKAVSILYWYGQLMNQNGWFFLSAGKLAELINVVKRSAALYIRRAINDGHIQKHIEYPKGTRQATEYIWTGEVKYLG